MSEGAEAFSEHYGPKTATRYVGMFRQILSYDFGELTQLIDRIEQFRHLIRRYDEQSGETVLDNVWKAVFQAGIEDASIRDHLTHHAGRINTFDKMGTEVSTVVRTRNDNDVVPMDVSVLKGKGVKGKDSTSKDGEAKDGKGKLKVEDDKDKTDPKLNVNKDRKCFYWQSWTSESRLSKEKAGWWGTKAVAGSDDFVLFKCGNEFARTFKRNIKHVWRYHIISARDHHPVLRVGRWFPLSHKVVCSECQWGHWQGHGWFWCIQCLSTRLREWACGLQVQHKIHFQTASGIARTSRWETCPVHGARHDHGNHASSPWRGRARRGCIIHERRRHDGCVFTRRSMGLWRDKIEAHWKHRFETRESNVLDWSPRVQHMMALRKEHHVEQV